MMTKGRYLLLGGLICLLALLSAGCETSFPEWSGSMPNENGRHVQPQNPDAQNDNQVIKPAGSAPALAVSTFTATQGGGVGESITRRMTREHGFTGISVRPSAHGGFSSTVLLHLSAVPASTSAP